MVADIKCEFTRNENEESKALAFCDLTLGLGQQGSLTLRGFRVLPGKNGEPWIAAPAKKGTSQWFDQVIFKGPLHKVVYAEVTKQYTQWSDQG